MPQSTLTDRTTTDAQGNAIALVREGGAITIVEDAEHRLTTIAGVEANDELIVGDRFCDHRHSSDSSTLDGSNRRSCPVANFYINGKVDPGSPLRGR